MIRRDKIGFIFQTFNLLPILNAVENVELPMETTGISKPERRDRAMKLLKTVGLSERWNHKPSELSGGERQRVAIARSLANNPPLLLADEPTGNLDSRTGKSIMKLLRELNHNLGTTVLVVTHDVSMAKKADRQLIVDDGKIKEKGLKKVKKGAALEDDLGLPVEITKKLKRAGYKDIHSVKDLSESQLSRVKGLKSKDIKKIQSKLRNYDR
jgi:ABC-type lipoprotein export system ATPase subunit